MTDEEFEQIHKELMRRKPSDPPGPTGFRRKTAGFGKSNAPILAHRGIFLERDESGRLTCPDLEQEALIKIWEKSKAGQLKTYYTQIALNEYRDLLREARTAERHLPAAEFMGGPRGRDIGGAIQDAIAGVNTQLERSGAEKEIPSISSDNPTAPAAFEFGAGAEFVFPPPPAAGRPPGSADKWPRARGGGRPKGSKDKKPRKRRR